MRQHVNPLSRFFQIPRDFPGIVDLFENPKLPLHLDIGSAKGEYLLSLAPLQQNWNHLGIEIRKPLVDSAIRQRDSLDIPNLNFLFGNANVSLSKWLQILPEGLLQRVSIQFPDPWFKRRHYKRRVLQPSLLIALTSAMNPGREFLIKTDIPELMESMSELIELSNCYILKTNDSGKIFSSAFMSSPTERESYAIHQKLPIYRLLFERNSKNPPSLIELEDAWLEKRVNIKDAEII